MQIDLSYGRAGLALELPAPADIIRGRPVPGLPDEAVTLREALCRPIGSAPLVEKVRPGDRVVIVHSDLTRPTPNDRILPPILEALESAGIRRQDITLLNALGTHRRQSERELRALLGDFIVDHYRCLQHDGTDEKNLVVLGATSLGHPVRINRTYMEADVRILTGFIEPHFFAGFSGGPKGVLPSIAGADSVQTNHSYAMLAHPQATWGVTDGNPVWEEMREAALLTRPTFLLNVTLNTRREITAVFAGDLLSAHAAGCDFVRQNAMVPVPTLYDVVVTTNSGYPLDQNLYQAIKGIHAASRITRDGGAIIMLSACEDGLPEHGSYASLLRRAGSPQNALAMLSAPGFSEPDAWNVQIQAQVLLRNRVHVYSDGLTDQQIKEALYLPCRDIPATITELMAGYGPQARLAVMPEGPQTIPYLDGSSSG